MIDPADPAAVHARAAERLFAEGRARESAVIYREIAEQATDDDVTAAVVAWHNLAVVEHHLGKIESAEVALLEAMRFVERVRGHPLRGVVLRKLGMLYDAMGNDAKATELLERALEDSTSMRAGVIRYAEMAIDLAAMHRRGKRAERGIDVLHRALERVTGFVGAEGWDARELLPWRAIVSLREASHPHGAPVAPYRDPGAKRAPRTTTIARILLLEERSALRAGRGELHASVDDGVAALKLRDELDEADDTATIDAALLVARRAARARRWADAAAILERVRDHASLPQDERALVCMEHAEPCSHDDRFEEAERSFAAARSQGGELVARLVLGVALSRVRRGDGEGALQILIEGSDTPTTTLERASFHHLRAEAHLLSGDVDRALADAKQAVFLADRSARAHVLPAALDALGEASRRKGDRSGAAAAFERALSLLSERSPLPRREIAQVTLHVAQLLEDEGLRDEAESRRACARELESHQPQ